MKRARIISAPPRPFHSPSSLSPARGFATLGAGSCFGNLPEREVKKQMELHREHYEEGIENSESLGSRLWDLGLEPGVRAWGLGFRAWTWSHVEKTNYVYLFPLGFRQEGR